MLIPHYELSQSSAVCFDLSSFGKLVLQGRDAAAFLQNFTTNDLIKPGAGSGCETFVTTAQAKLVAWLRVAVRSNDLYLNMEPGIVEKLHAHLQKYVIGEEVEFADRTQSDFLLLLSGPAVPEMVQRFGVAWGQCPLWHNAALRDGCWLQRCDFLGQPGVFVWGARVQSSVLLQEFDSFKVPLLTLAEPLWNTLRVEAMVPSYGIDLDDSNLPQESGRTVQAISFTKGCYIGQETVARIRAYGHVNRQLIRVRFEKELEQLTGWSNAVLKANEKEVGRIRTVAYSPRAGAVLALAIVRKEHLAECSVMLAQQATGAETVTVTTMRQEITT